ncbi:MAG: acyclic terpene utilization AtuA family protein [Hyphomonadaceae bacterium]|nr:acyclic terpene utilization AtuA family protein [Hyphomonadaceae bacterium]
MGLHYISFFVGAGFPNEALAAAADLPLDFVGADAGTIDVGPYQLAGDGTIFSETLCRHDLTRALRLARQKKIPFVIGSCGGSGRNWGVDWFADMVRQAAREQGLGPLRIARIYAEPDRDYLKQKLSAGEIRPLSASTEPYTQDHIDRSTRIVGVMGVEPFIAALESGADVVLAGRATDSAIFAAIPLMWGKSAALSWHAAKVAECGGAIGDPAKNDLLHVVLENDSFLVRPLAPGARCTPWSVAAHQLYENADPTRFVEPSGTIDASTVDYREHDANTTRISGARFEPAAQYTMKLEGVEPVGYQSIAMASYSDRVLLEELPDWLVRMRQEVDAKLARVFGDHVSEAILTIRTYGAGDGADLFAAERPGVPQADAFFLLDAVAPSQEMATAVANVAWHTLVHFPPSRWRGGVLTAAWPFNPPIIERGRQHRFNVNHVVVLEDPLEMLRFEYEDVT